MTDSRTRPPHALGADFFSRSLAAETGAPQAPEAVAAEANRPAVRLALPIRSLARRHVPAIVSHLLALEPADRYLRFGYAASDEQVVRYAEGIDFARDELFGVFNRHLRLVAMAHLSYSVQPDRSSAAELGLSVSQHLRGRGLGAQLFERAVLHARNHGVEVLHIHALSENAAMLTIARHAGALIQHDGPESEAFLKLPPADFDSQVTELVNEQLALTNYHLKARFQPLLSALALFQDIRQGVRASRYRVRGRFLG